MEKAAGEGGKLELWRKVPPGYLHLRGWVRTFLAKVQGMRCEKEDVFEGQRVIWCVKLRCQLPASSPYPGRAG